MPAGALVNCPASRHLFIAHQLGSYCRLSRLPYFLCHHHLQDRTQTPILKSSWRGEQAAVSAIMSFCTAGFVRRQCRRDSNQPSRTRSIPATDEMTTRMLADGSEGANDDYRMYMKLDGE